MVSRCSHEYGHAICKSNALPLAPRTCTDDANLGRLGSESPRNKGIVSHSNTNHYGLEAVSALAVGAAKCSCRVLGQGYETRAILHIDSNNPCLFESNKPSSQYWSGPSAASRIVTSKFHLTTDSWFMAGSVRLSLPFSPWLFSLRPA
jgi:hypothetical protein